MAVVKGDRYALKRDTGDGKADFSIYREDDGGVWVCVEAIPNDSTGLTSLTWAEFEEIYLYLKEVKEALGWKTE